MIPSLYQVVKAQASLDLASDETRDSIVELVDGSLGFLKNECSRVQLVSRVWGKSYVAFTQGGHTSRPVRPDLLRPDPGFVSESWTLLSRGALEPTDIRSLLYTSAIAPCLALEILTHGNKKGPATYFECIIGHLFARKTGRNPSKRARLTVGDRQIALTMDFLFEATEAGSGLHLPVKMSTRERAVQAWSHQRLLDGAFGEGVFVGKMVLFSETKLDSRNFEVVEICVPDQWLLYQQFLARFETIYYFDPPDRYVTLSEQYPDIVSVKSIEQALLE